MKHFNDGENNGMWKGDDAGYGSIHEWVRSRKPKPELCERCNKRKAVDLANISQEYKRDVNDYEYLCRKCHMDEDGRNNKLRESGKSRKLENQICECCGIEYHRDKISKYCSRACYTKSRTGVKRDPAVNKKVSESIKEHWKIRASKKLNPKNNV